MTISSKSRSRYIIHFLKGKSKVFLPILRKKIKELKNGRV